MEREREGGSRLMQISYSDFSPFFLLARGEGFGLIERRKPLTVPWPCVFP